MGLGHRRVLPLHGHVGLGRVAVVTLLQFVQLGRGEGLVAGEETVAAQRPSTTVAKEPADAVRGEGGRGGESWRIIMHLPVHHAYIYIDAYTYIRFYTNYKRYIYVHAEE